MDAFSFSMSGSMVLSVFRKMLRFIQLKITDKYEVPPEIIRIKDTTIATLGNISASVGKPKSKKTFNLSAIVASALSGKEVLYYKANLPVGKEKILYVDTEQSKCHCHKVMARILRLAGLPLDKEPENLKFLMLREYTPDQRRQIVSCAIEEDKRISLVIIDGIRDLLRDINSPGESQDVMGDLMRWTSHYNVHVHTVLHLNKGDDNTRGHIGTELNNKAETVLQITKSQNDSNISEVKAMHIRDKEFEPFAFCINSEALPEIVSEYSINVERKLTVDTIPEELHRQALEEVFLNGDIAKYEELISRLQRSYSKVNYKRGKNKINDLLKYLSGRNIIEKTADGYHYNPDFDSLQTDE